MSAEAKDAIRADRSELVEAIVRAGGVSKGTNSWKCPFHEDRSPSGSVYRGEDGVWRFKCHACNFCEDIYGVQARASGVPVGDLLKRKREAAAPSREKPARVFPTIDAMLESVGHYLTVAGHFVYTNPVTGRPDMVVIRCEDGVGAERRKTFRQARPAHDGGFEMLAPPKPWPLYNRVRVARAGTVIVAEGEKCVHALHDAGHVATTSPGGAGKAGLADWSPLAGKRVYLWPDNDGAGVEHMRQVAVELRKLPTPPVAVLWIDPAGFKLPEKSDAVDYLAQYGGDSPAVRTEAVQCALDTAESFGASASVRKLIADTLSGRRYAVEWPWTELGEITNALLPGTVTVICGDPAASKSFLLLQAAAHWHATGLRVALYQLEADEEGSHLLRSMVQKSGRVELLSPRWMAAHPDETNIIFSANEEFLDSFGARLWTPPRTPPTLATLSAWVADRARDGCRVICIDPVTAAEGSDRPWEDDKRFLLDAQAVTRECGASLVLVTHPKKGRKLGSTAMEDAAGGAAYGRFSQTMLWVRRHSPAKRVMVKRSGMEYPVEVNRTVHISKSRLGPGHGQDLAYIFGGGMKFAEQGIVVPKAPKTCDDEPGEGVAA